MASSMTPANPATAEVALFLSGRAFIKYSQSFFMINKGVTPSCRNLPALLLKQQNAGFFLYTRRKLIGDAGFQFVRLSNLTTPFPYVIISFYKFMR